MVPTGTVTAALRVPFARRRSGWAKGSQSLKSPTTDTAPKGWSAGRAKVTRPVPLRPGLVVLINCSLRSALGHSDRPTVPHFAHDDSHCPGGDIACREPEPRNQHAPRTRPKPNVNGGLR